MKFRTQRMLDVHRIRSLGVLASSRLDLASSLDVELGGSESVLDVHGIEALAVGSSSVDLLVHYVELRGVYAPNS